jgi:mortality factor 4-like protein 1
LIDGGIALFLFIHVYYPGCRYVTPACLFWSSTAINSKLYPPCEKIGRMSNPVTYVIGERVLCYHGPLIYEAKVKAPPVLNLIEPFNQPPEQILKIDNATEANPHPKTGCTGAHYLVHYKGWKQSWDEWILPSRLLKWNETNLTIQKNLVAQTKQAGPGAGGSNKSAGASSGGMGTGGRGAARKEGRKRGREEVSILLPIPNLFTISV